ncbi:helix-turn-helix domain-containing protein [Streptomyces sp. NPDC056387]|uniref:helix-turn-helix domain-containing protein n=1 Tax=Streptomyces sp. NPDC056387 TaxID=3345803 RepID=UPI0035E00D1E
MSIAAIQELLLAGYSNAAIARQLNVAHARVARLRKEMGLPVHKAGSPAAASPEDLFWRRAQPTSDGHLIWPNPSGDIRHITGRTKASRVAFRIRYRREPVRNVLPDCGRDGCVHPDHVADQPMRKTYAAIFGPAAAA